MKRAVDEFLPCADILKISDEELEFITGCDDIRAALPSLYDGNIKLVLFTCGKNGAYAFTKNAEGHTDVMPCEVVDTTGAGDASIGSFLWKLNEFGITKENISDISPDKLNEALAFMSRYCSISVGAKGAIPSYPTLEQVQNRYI